MIITLSRSGSSTEIGRGAKMSKEVKYKVNFTAFKVWLSDGNDRWQAGEVEVTDGNEWTALDAAIDAEIAPPFKEHIEYPYADAVAVVNWREDGAEKVHFTHCGEDLDCDECEKCSWHSLSISVEEIAKEE